MVRKRTRAIQYSKLFGKNEVFLEYFVELEWSIFGALKGVLWAELG